MIEYIGFFLNKPFGVILALNYIMLKILILIFLVLLPRITLSGNCKKVFLKSSSKESQINIVENRPISRFLYEEVNVVALAHKTSLEKIVEILASDALKTHQKSIRPYTDPSKVFLYLHTNEPFTAKELNRDLWDNINGGYNIGIILVNSNILDIRSDYHISLCCINYGAKSDKSAFPSDEQSMIRIRDRIQWIAKKTYQKNVRLGINKPFNYLFLSASEVPFYDNISNIKNNIIEIWVGPGVKADLIQRLKKNKISPPQGRLWEEVIIDPKPNRKIPFP